MIELLKLIGSSNKDDFAIEVKEDDKIVYYPSPKAVKDGIEKSMA